MAKDLLIEIGTEPMPARFVEPALAQLKEGLRERLAASLLAPEGEIVVVGTLRRLTATASGLPERSAAKTERYEGPPATLLKDAEGRFTRQAEGFAAKYETTADQLRTGPSSKGKGEVLIVEKEFPGRPAKEILGELICELLAALQFPKTLTWEESGFRFGRPIRTLTVLFGKTGVPVKVAGVRSGRTVSGLPSLGKKPVVLSEPSKYASTLRDLLVIVDPAERRQDLLTRLRLAAKQGGGRLDEDAALVEETVWMTEQPTPVVGRFEERFLQLPAALLSMVLKKQLKFFPLLQPQGEGLVPSFLGVRDGTSEGQSEVRYGYQRVLTARLSDAAFFLDRDVKVPLEGRLPQLARVTYQKGLGSMADKTERVSKLSRWLASELSADRGLREESVRLTAQLCYCDLVTDVVREFPELQGTMGGFYARQEGLDERAALGLEQFYFPVAAKSPLPATDEGAVVSLAGKLDSLAGSFAIGVIPTGSADPYALRRQGAGALRILIEKQLPLDLEKALAEALRLQPAALEGEARAKTLADLREFLWARAQSMFEEMGFAADEIRSVRAGAFADLPRAMLRLSAIHAVRKDPSFEPLAAAFKRASNILRQAKVADAGGAPAERSALKEPAELGLFDALAALEGDVGVKLDEGRFEDGLKALVGLKPQVDFFFEKVMVMAPEPELRAQRLALLLRLVRLFKRVADLSEIQAPGSPA